jgi:hypothetical protein
MDYSLFPVNIEPLLKTHADNDVEQELYQIFCDVFEEYIRDKERDVNVSGMPHLGSFDLVSRHVEKDGLALINKGDEAAMRYLFKAWKARNPKRGLHFIKTYLQLLWKGEASAYQMWQDKAHPYPTRLYESEQPNSFLTSRIRVVFDDLIGRENITNEIMETAPALRSSLALRFVLEIYARLSLSIDSSAYASALFLERDTAELEFQSSGEILELGSKANASAIALLFETESGIEYQNANISQEIRSSSYAECVSIIREV